jgi:hypothetical protein
MARHFIEANPAVANWDRFDVRLEHDDTWTVYDIFSGLPVRLDDMVMIKTTAEASFYLVDTLNEQDLERRQLLGI